MNINYTMVFVYALPERMSDGFAFGGPKPITFGNVDWFNGFDGMTESDLKSFVSRKRYAKQHNRLLILSPDNGIAMIITPEPPTSSV
jgi:hypothetical protein